MSKPDFREAALNYASALMSDRGWVEKETELLILADFTAGADHGYSLAMEQHRDFYLTVRSYYQILDGCPGEKGTALGLEDIDTKIRKHLTAFTSRELESLPFKD
jgi:hypothetical protein